MKQQSRKQPAGWQFRLDVAGHTTAPLLAEPAGGRRA